MGYNGPCAPSEFECGVTFATSEAQFLLPLLLFANIRTSSPSLFDILDTWNWRVSLCHPSGEEKPYSDFGLDFSSTGFPTDEVGNVSQAENCILSGREAAGTREPVAGSYCKDLSTPWTELMTVWIFFNDRLTLFIFRDGHREIPCCLHIRFKVVGQTAMVFIGVSEK